MLGRVLVSMTERDQRAGTQITTDIREMWWGVPSGAEGFFRIGEFFFKPTACTFQSHTNILSLAPGHGFEPRLNESESFVLPLDEPGMELAAAEGIEPSMLCERLFQRQVALPASPTPQWSW